MASNVERSSLMAAAAMSLAALSLSAWVGYVSVASSHGTGGLFASGAAPEQSFGSLFLHILGRNLPAALLLFSGVVTLSVSTVLALMLLGVFLGATFTVASDNVGATQMFGSIIAYGPLELVGFALAATAGLLPLTRFLMARRAVSAVSGEHPGRAQRYALALPTSLRLLAVASGTLVLAAVIESAVVALR